MFAKKLNDNITKKDETKFSMYERPDPFKFIVPDDCPFVLKAVSKKRMENMGGVDPRGWVPITREEFTKYGIKTTNYRGEFYVGAKGNTIEIGDLILCKMPKEIAQERKEFFEEKARRRASQVKENFKAQARHMEPFGDIKSSRTVMRDSSDDSDD